MRTLLATWIGIAVLLLSACGGAPDEGAAENGTADPASPQQEEPDETEQTLTLRLLYVPVATKAPLFLGMEQGFFEDEGIELDVAPVQTGPEIAAAVVSGEAQIGSPALVPVINAVASGGLPLRAIATSVAAVPPSTDDRGGNYVVLVGEDSDIHTAADLNGRTVAVNALQAVLELAARAAADREGADSDTFDFVAIPFPEMNAALESGRVDAIVTPEPFVQAALAQGHRELLIAYPYDPATGRTFPQDVYFTSAEYAEQNPDIIERFQRAMDATNAYAQDNPDEVRRIIPTFTELSPEVAEKISLPQSPPISREDIDAVVDLMVQYDILDREPDLSDFLSLLESGS